MGRQFEPRWRDGAPDVKETVDTSHRLRETAGKIKLVLRRGRKQVAKMAGNQTGCRLLGRVCLS